MMIICSEFLKKESLLLEIVGPPKLSVILCRCVIVFILIRFSKIYITQKTANYWPSPNEKSSSQSEKQSPQFHH